MLILTRRPGETLIAEMPNGQTIELTIMGIKGNQVRIGVEAPKDIPVHRKEIYDRIHAGEPAPTKKAG